MLAPEPAFFQNIFITTSSMLYLMLCQKQVNNVKNNMLFQDIYMLFK